MVSTHRNTKCPPVCARNWTPRPFRVCFFTTTKFTNRLKLNINSPTKRIDCKENMSADWTFPYFILSNGNVTSCKTFLHNCIRMSYLLLVVYLLFTPVFFNTNMFSKLASKSFDPVQFSTSKRGHKTLEGARISKAVANHDLMEAQYSGLTTCEYVLCVAAFPI